MILKKTSKPTYAALEILRRAAGANDGEIATSTYGIRNTEYHRHEALCDAGYLRHNNNQHVDMDDYLSWYVITPLGRKIVEQYAHVGPPLPTAKQLALLREAAADEDGILRLPCNPKRDPVIDQYLKMAERVTSNLYLRGFFAEEHVPWEGNIPNTKWYRAYRLTDKGRALLDVHGSGGWATREAGSGERTEGE